MYLDMLPDDIVNIILLKIGKSQQAFLHIGDRYKNLYNQMTHKFCNGLFDPMSILKYDTSNNGVYLNKISYDLRNWVLPCKFYINNQEVFCKDEAERIMSLKLCDNPDVLLNITYNSLYWNHTAKYTEIILCDNKEYIFYMVFESVSFISYHYFGYSIDFKKFWMDILNDDTKSFLLHHNDLHFYTPRPLDRYKSIL